MQIADGMVSANDSNVSMVSNAASGWNGNEAGNVSMASSSASGCYESREELIKLNVILDKKYGRTPQSTSFSVMVDMIKRNEAFRIYKDRQLFKAKNRRQILKALQKHRIRYLAKNNMLPTDNPSSMFTHVRRRADHEEVNKNTLLSIPVSTSHSEPGSPYISTAPTRHDYNRMNVTLPAQQLYEFVTPVTPMNGIEQESSQMEELDVRKMSKMECERNIDNSAMTSMNCLRPTGNHLILKLLLNKIIALLFVFNNWKGIIFNIISISDAAECIDSPNLFMQRNGDDMSFDMNCTTSTQASTSSLISRREEMLQLNQILDEKYGKTAKSKSFEVLETMTKRNDFFGQYVERKLSEGKNRRGITRMLFSSRNKYLKKDNAL